MTSTVVGILDNPRCTGRQVWNRHSTVDNHRDARRTGGTGGRTNAEDWAVSNTPAYAALVDEAMFRSVQGIRAEGKSQDGNTRTYLLARADHVRGI
ncbi:recombinase family protein [Saccharopolyspora shandongensis]|uniref:recombinase family protein n=1 Tax=Saccharopolyspora shandongensis TaxID=418495 RepID=UPI003F4D7482